MKKYFIVLALIFGLTFAATANASYVTTLDFYGGIMYDVEGVEFPEDVVPGVDEEWDENEDLADFLNEEAPYGLVGAVAYDIDWNLPDWNTEYSWYLDVDVWLEGEGSVDGDEWENFGGEIDDGFTLGEFSLQDMTGASRTQVVDALRDIPRMGYDEDIGGYLIDGNLHSGEIYFALEEDVPEDLFDFFDIEMPYEMAQAEFGGTVQLIARGDCLEEPQNVVPEPASMLLMSFGLMGFAGMRKKK
ncbi:MAG: PEP-CTERM sorting domain-containing protein [Candidatus Omnitrophica bacterium]|nr:PEP-CTERM sorting domain-containing protein [Candidatus Omnitrophota bacterium]